MNKIKIYFVIFFIASGSHLHSQVFWEAIKSPVDVNLRKVFFLDSLHVWAAGDSGTIIFSSDMGETWDIQNSGLPERIEDIFFFNDSLGWAITWTSAGTNYRSHILYTIDGGLNWDSRDYRTPDILLTTIFFTDSLNGWTCGIPFEFSYTSDGGSDWYPANIDTGSFAYYTVNELMFSTPQYGFAVGGVHDAIGVVWRTTNGGELWKAYGIGPDLFLDFVFLDSVTVLALTAELEGFYPMGELRFDLLMSKWTYNELEEFVYVTGIDLRTDYEVWGTIGNGTKSFIVSNDSLKTWQIIDTPASLFAFDIAFADSVHGIAVGEGGYIFRYIPQEPVSIFDENKDKSPDEFFLYQNYPNPFNASTVIGWQLAAGSYVTLKIYDLLGKEVSVIVNEEKDPGIYEVIFNAEDLSSGVYYYRLTTGDHSFTNKMLILK